MEEVFGARIHHELVKRVPKVLNLLADEGLFADSHSALLWGACTVRVRSLDLASSPSWFLFSCFLTHLPVSHFSHFATTGRAAGDSC